jgi:hypothetical protein
MPQRKLGMPQSVSPSVQTEARGPVKRVVYVLGAGFSAPLGIPTIGQFLQRAKDLLQERPSELAYFKDIFSTIQTLQVANNFYSTNTDNIEDLLTLLDFRNAISDKSDPTQVNDETQVKKFISDVITGSMTPMQVDKASQRWDSLLFWDRPWTDYGLFVSALWSDPLIVDREVRRN